MHHILCPGLWKTGQAGAQNSETADGVIETQCRSKPSIKRPQKNLQREKGEVSSISRQCATKKTGKNTNETSASQRPTTGPTGESSLNGSSPESTAKSIDSEAAKREAQCITFQGDEDSDYTRGPVRIITASDGVDDNCAVLLLNRHFSASIKAAISARRELVNFIDKSQKQDEETEESQRKLREKIKGYRLRKAYLEAEDANTAMEEAVAHALKREMREIDAKIGELENALYAEATDQRLRHESLQLHYKDCFKLHEPVHRFLEAAFVDAELLPPTQPTPKVPVPRKWKIEKCGQQDKKTDRVRRDLGGGVPKQRHEERAAARRYSLEQYAHEDPQRSTTMEGMTSSRNSGSTSSHHSETSEQHESSSPSHLHRDYVRAKNRLTWAQWEFDLRDETRDREHYWNERDLRRSGGTEGIPEEKFDLLWVEHNSKLTRELIDAEEAFKTARIAAVKGGCELDDPDASSVFEDDENEGYPPSREAAWKAHAPKAMIEGWRQSIPAVSDIPNTSAASPELDSQDGDEADAWGSWSAVADPPRQAKIKQWEKTCTVAGKKPVE